MRISLVVFLVVFIALTKVAAQTKELKGVADFLKEKGYKCMFTDNILTIKNSDESTTYNKFLVVKSESVDSNYINSRKKEYYVQSCSNMIRTDGAFHHNFKIHEEYFIQENCSSCSDNLYGDAKKDDCHMYKLNMLLLIDELNGQQLSW